MADNPRNETQNPENQRELLQQKQESRTSASISEEVDIFLSTEEIKHEFSSPWQNSDLVLIIEDQKIHVHRLILQLTSPVLSKFVQETDSNEVSLPRTNVSEFVDLLRVIYPQVKNQITLANIEHIYNLAEEYEIQSVIEVCREYLVHVKKTTTNVMEILVITQECKCDEAREQCYEILKKSTVKMLTSNEYFDDLDEQSLRSVLLPRAERLETCLREIQPQLIGLIDCVLYLWLQSESKLKLMAGSPNKCPVHHASSRACTSMQTRIKCPTCRAMFVQMARYSGFKGLGGNIERYYSYTGMYFDEKIMDVFQEMFSLLKM